MQFPEGVFPRALQYLLGLWLTNPPDYPSKPPKCMLPELQIFFATRLMSTIYLRQIHASPFPPQRLPFWNCVSVNSRRREVLEARNHDQAGRPATLKESRPTANVPARRYCSAFRICLMIRTSMILHRVMHTQCSSTFLTYSLLHTIYSS
jgi:hypothetical protein